MSHSSICSLQGAYRDDDCKPVVLNVVREAEARIAGSLFMEYLPIGGNKVFTDLSVKLAFGEDAKPIQEGRIAAVQSLSGTGGCCAWWHVMISMIPYCCLLTSTAYAPICPNWVSQLLQNTSHSSCHRAALLLLLSMYVG